MTLMASFIMVVSSSTLPGSPFQVLPGDGHYLGENLRHLGLAESTDEQAVSLPPVVSVGKLLGLVGDEALHQLEERRVPVEHPLCGPEEVGWARLTVNTSPNQKEA